MQNLQASNRHLLKDKGPIENLLISWGHFELCVAVDLFSGCGRGGVSPKYVAILPTLSPLCSAPLSIITCIVNPSSRSGFRGARPCCPWPNECQRNWAVGHHCSCRLAFRERSSRINDSDPLDEALSACSVGRSLAGRLNDAHLTRNFALPITRSRRVKKEKKKRPKPEKNHPSHPA